MNMKVVGGTELPAELKKQLSSHYLQGGTNYADFLEKLTPLFAEKDKLSIDEMIVGWYYAYNRDILKRASLQSKLSKLVESGELVKVARGIFSLAAKDPDVT